VDTEKLREHLEIVEPHLLSVDELLQMLVPTNSIYPIYAKEGKHCEKELGGAINAFLEMKKELGLPSNLTPTIPEDEMPRTSDPNVNIDTKKLQEHLNIVETSIHSVIENIHMINTAHAIYPIRERDGIQCEVDLALTMNALLELRNTLDLYSVSERAKAVEQLSRKEVQCTSTAELLVNWQCPLCQANLSTTLDINKGETEPCLIYKPHYSIPVEAQECPALIFYVTYRHPEINVVASIPEQ
jgi:hypothetical protein